VTGRFVATVVAAALAASAWLAYRDAAAVLLLGDALFVCG
jgi:hypothetical protein